MAYLTVHMLDTTFYTSDILKLGLAAVIGSIVGLEREANGQAAGFRTYLTVCVGSCLMMVLSLRLDEIAHVSGLDPRIIRIDPGRIASYAIAGMGFLGAGAIIKGRGTVRGLTTAAGLWVITGIGLAIGAGQVVSALVTTLIILLGLFIIHPMRSLSDKRMYWILTIETSTESFDYGKIQGMLDTNAETRTLFTNYSRNFEEGTTTCRIRLFSSRWNRSDWLALLEGFSSMEGVQNIKLEESDVP